jgi:hypothetical protein
MADAYCTCGFTEDEAADETISDHLLAVFTPGDDKGNDGRFHLEAEPDLTCLCGLATAMADELDAHFLAVFTPDDGIGHDGKRHAIVTASTRNGGQ